MKIEAKYLNYVLPILLLSMAAVFHSASFAYASCLALALGYAKEYTDKQLETKMIKTDDTLKRKVEGLEAAVSAMVMREKARGF